MTAGNTVQVIEKFVHIEGSSWRSQHGDCLQAGIEGLVGSPLIGIKGSAPVSFPVQTHIPVAQVFGNKILDQPGRPGRFIIFILRLHIFYQGIEQGDDPTIYFGSLLNRNLSCLVGKAIHIGIESKKRVSVVKGPEKLSFYLIHTRNIKFQVIPGLRIGDHIPSQGI